MSLKLRVIATTAVAVLVAVSVVGLFAYTLVSRQLLASIDDALRVAAAEAKIGAQNQGGPALPPDVPNAIGIARVNPATGAIEVVRTAGSVDDPQPFPALTAEQVRAAAGGPVSVDAPTSFRVYVRVMDPRRGTAVAATSLEEYQRSLDDFASRLTIALAAVLLIVISASGLVARRMLRPLDDIVVSAERITSGDSTTRVPASGSAIEVRQLADSLNAMIDRLAASESNLRAFISDTSHEIRTPLTVISGYIQKLQADAERQAPVDPDALRRLAAESDRLERLVTQLLRLDKYGSPAGRTTSVRLDTLMREELADLEALNPDRVVALRLEPVSVEGDEDALRQAFANIRQNLERYTPPDTLVEANLTIEGPDAVILIDDSGPGIPDPARRAALSSLQRDDSLRERSTEGFGLGMAIIATVVAGHHGTFHLDLSPLGGLRTRITLPLLSGPGSGE